MYCYRGRIEMDHCEVVDVEDGKDSQFNLNVKNAWKLHDTAIDKWYLLFTKSPEEKIRWLGAFAEERKRVADDNDKGIGVLSFFPSFQPLLHCLPPSDSLPPSSPSSFPAPPTLPALGGPSLLSKF